MSGTAVEEYINGLSGEQAWLAASIWRSIEMHVTDVRGTVVDGHPVWYRGEEPIVALETHGDRTTVTLWRGQLVDDPSGRLTAVGDEQAATVEYAGRSDFDGAMLREWLQRALAL